MLYVRSNTPHRRCTELEPEPRNYHGTELMIIEAQLCKTEKWLIIVIYKHPKVNNKHLELFFLTYVKRYKRNPPIGSSWVIQILI